MLICFFKPLITINENSNTSTIPFTILVPLILHHTPFIPKISGLNKIIAKGTLNPVKIIHIIDGITVLPTP